MIKLKRYTEDNLEIFSLEIARLIKVSILGSNIKGQHVSLDITVWRIGVSIGLNFWKLEIK
jgi:hypothetical protein